MTTLPTDSPDLLFCESEVHRHKQLPENLVSHTHYHQVAVRNLKISAGAGFIVALTGEIMTMPGLPKVPAAERIDVDETGKITGLF